MTIIETVKSKLVLDKKHLFNYSGGNGEMDNEITSVGAAILTADTNANKNDLSRFTLIQTPSTENVDLEQMIGEDTLSCGNYLGIPVKNLTGLLEELAKLELSPDESVVVVMFKNDTSLKGYVALKLDSSTNNAEVHHVCSTAVLDFKRSAVKSEPELDKMLKDGMEGFLEMLKAGITKNNRGNKTTTELDLKPCHNFYVILRLVKMLGGKTVEFKDGIPVQQLKSLLTSNDSSNNASNTNTKPSDNNSAISEPVKTNNQKSAKNSAEEGENTSRQNSAKSASAKSASAKSASAKSASAKSASVKSASAKRKGKTPSIKVVVGSIDGKADDNSNKMSLDVNVEVSGLTEDCEDVMFALMRDDKQIGDSMSSKHGGESEVKADLKFTLEGDSEDLCSSKYKLDVQVKCDGRVLKQEMAITKRVRDAMLCSAKPVNSSLERTPEDEEEISLVDMNDLIDLKDLYMEGNTYYYTKKIYNVKGNMVEGKTVNLPADFMSSMGINESHFVLNEDGKYRFKPPANVSSTDKKIIKERLRKQVKEELIKEYGDEVFTRNNKSREKSSKSMKPEERRRLNRMQLEREKLQMKREKDERDAALIAEKQQQAREDRLAKREDNRYREKMRMNQKQMEQQHQMARAMFEAQRKQSGDKPQSGMDKAMMEQMFKMMRESKKADQPVMQEIKKEKRSKEAPVVQQMPAAVVLKQPSKKSKSKKGSKKLEKKYKRLIKLLEAQQKKKKPKTKVSRRVREMIIRRYKQSRKRRGSKRGRDSPHRHRRSRHGRGSRHGSRSKHHKSKHGEERRSKHGSKTHRHQKDENKPKKPRTRKHRSKGKEQKQK